MMENIEKLYTPSEWCSQRCDPDRVVKKHIEAVTLESLKIEKEFRFVANLRYGDKPKQLLDLFEPSKVLHDDIPTFIYIHGGYWQELGKDISRYCVKPLLKANIRVIIPGYDLAPDATIETIIKEIEDLNKYVRSLAAKHNWKNIWYSGHSAGAHLAASLMCSENSSKLDVDGFVLISGIYNLEPLIRTSINKKLNITRENYKSLSPLYRLASIQCKRPKVVIIVAEYDSPAFHEQSVVLKQEMEKLKFDATMHIIQDTDHFTVVENLKNDDFVLTKIIIKNILQARMKIVHVK